VCSAEPAAAGVLQYTIVVLPGCSRKRRRLPSSSASAASTDVLPLGPRSAPPRIRVALALTWAELRFQPVRTRMH